MPHKNDLNVWSKWDPLKKVAIGSCVNPEYFEHVANIEIREKLQKIVLETQEDLDNIANHCSELGAEVVRTKPNHSNIQTRLNPDQKAEAIGWLMYPRDNLAVLGNCLVASSPEVIAKKYYESILPPVLDKNLPWYDLSVNKKVAWTDPPCWTLVGKDLFVDTETYRRSKDFATQPVWQNVIETWIEKWLPQVDVHWVTIGGHNDGCFHTLKPGAMMSLHDIMTYEETFPGWDVLYLPDQSWVAVQDFLQMKKKNQGKYWIPGEQNNDEFINYINTWLSDWVGYVEETVFDVNCLVFDQSTVLVNNYNKEVFDFLKRHKMEPIICPMRHRYFFDGGIHCVSLDLYREGQCQSYIDYK